MVLCGKVGCCNFLVIVPLKYIEYGFGYTIIRSPYTPCSIYLRGTMRPCKLGWLSGTTLVFGRIHAIPRGPAIAILTS